MISQKNSNSGFENKSFILLMDKTSILASHSNQSLLNKSKLIVFTINLRCTSLNLTEKLIAYLKKRVGKY